MATSPVYPPSPEFVRAAQVQGMDNYRALYSKAAADPEAPGQVEELLALKNVLHAVRILGGQWTAGQRGELAALIDPISRNHAEPRIRTDAIDALVTLRKN